MLVIFSSAVTAATMQAIKSHEWQEVWGATLQCRNDDESRRSLSVNFAAVCLLQVGNW